MEETYLAILLPELRQEISKYIRHSVPVTYCRACMRRHLNLERLDGQLGLLPPIALDICQCPRAPNIPGVVIHRPKLYASKDGFFY